MRAQVTVTIALLLGFLVLFLTEHRLSDRFDILWCGLCRGSARCRCRTDGRTPGARFHSGFAHTGVRASLADAQPADPPVGAYRRHRHDVSRIALVPGFSRSAALSLLFAAGYLLIASYASVTEQAERAGAQSQALVEEFQNADRQLTENAATIEHLAFVEERNRLARELHGAIWRMAISMVSAPSSTT